MPTHMHACTVLKTDVEFVCKNAGARSLWEF